MAGADVGASRETQRRLRWVRLTAVVWLVAAVLWLRAVSYDGAGFVPLPSIDPFLLTIVVFFGLLMAPADVVGIDGVKDDVVRSLNLFLAHKTFS